MYHHHGVARNCSHMVAEPCCGSTEPSIQEQTYSLLQQSSFVGPELSTHLARSEVSTMIRQLATQEHYAVLAQLVSLISTILKMSPRSLGVRFRTSRTMMKTSLSRRARRGSSPCQLTQSSKVVQTNRTLIDSTTWSCHLLKDRLHQHRLR